MTPVCASDGVTYSSECHFMRSKCLHHHQQQRQRQSQYQSLHLLHHPDHNSVNISQNQHLLIQEVDLIAAANTSTADAVIVHPGACRGSQNRSASPAHPAERTLQPDLCARTTCSFSGVCQVEENLKGIVSCRCPDCTDDQQAVCGSDGTTYTNECFLRKQSCERQAMISVVHEGHCRGCQDLNCSHHSRCQISAAGKAECLCPECPVLAKKKPVCGSNGLTYESGVPAPNEVV